jgi:hypothetical protein
MYEKLQKYKYDAGVLGYWLLLGCILYIFAFAAYYASVYMSLGHRVELDYVLNVLMIWSALKPIFALVIIIWIVFSIFDAVGMLIMIASGMFIWFGTIGLSVKLLSDRFFDCNLPVAPHNICNDLLYCCVYYNVLPSCAGLGPCPNATMEVDDFSDLTPNQDIEILGIFTLIFFVLELVLTLLAVGVLMRLKRLDHSVVLTNIALRRYYEEGPGDLNYGGNGEGGLAEDAFKNRKKNDDDDDEEEEDEKDNPEKDKTSLADVKKPTVQSRIAAPTIGASIHMPLPLRSKTTIPIAKKIEQTTPLGGKKKAPASNAIKKTPVKITKGLGTNVKNSDRGDRSRFVRSVAPAIAGKNDVRIPMDKTTTMTRNRECVKCCNDVMRCTCCYGDGGIQAKLHLFAQTIASKYNSAYYYAFYHLTTFAINELYHKKDPNLIYMSNKKKGTSYDKKKTK